MDRLGGKIQLDSIGAALGGQQAAAGLEEGRLVGREMAFFPEDVGCRQSGVAAQVDFLLGSEPAKVEFRARAEPCAKAVSERFISPATSCIHVSSAGSDKHANRRGVAGETTIGERVDLADAHAHGWFLHFGSRSAKPPHSDVLPL